MSAHAKALVVTCMDLRFQKTVHEWLKERGLYGNHDRVAFAGAGGNFDYLISQVRLSMKLHSPSEIHILNHQSCGYYGASLKSGSQEELKKHTADLKRAQKEIKTEYPKVAVKGYFISLDQKITKINFSS